MKLRSWASCEMRVVSGVICSPHRLAPPPLVFSELVVGLGSLLCGKYIQPLRPRQEPEGIRAANPEGLQQVLVIALRASRMIPRMAARAGLTSSCRHPGWGQKLVDAVGIIQAWSAR